MLLHWQTNNMDGVFVWVFLHCCVLACASACAVCCVLCYCVGICLVFCCVPYLLITLYLCTFQGWVPSSSELLQHPRCSALVCFGACGDSNLTQWRGRGAAGPRAAGGSKRNPSLTASKPEQGSGWQIIISLPAACQCQWITVNGRVTPKDSTPGNQVSSKGPSMRGAARQAITICPNVF